MKTVYIVNSMALRRFTSGWEQVNNHVQDDSSAHRKIKLTKWVGQSVSLARDAVKSGCDMVVAVGGDGTVNEVLNGIFENNAPINKDVILGVIPLGSGCDFARGLGIPKIPSGLGN